MIESVNWKYYRLPLAGLGRRCFYVRIDEQEEIAETREPPETEWEREDVYFGEVYFNGAGVPCTEAEAQAAASA